jgi:peptidoglycan L-alanyl-D-glutamate endopeptidase CwlK
MPNLKLLKPKVKALAFELQKRAKEIGIDIIFTSTLRTKTEQNKLYARGRTAPGKIVTQARSGESMHNYGVAFDICPVINNQAAWNNTALFNQVGKIGMAIGLEWGGSWKGFVDKPHFQYTAGYNLDDFKTDKIDMKKFV